MTISAGVSPAVDGASVDTGGAVAASAAASPVAAPITATSTAARRQNARGRVPSRGRTARRCAHPNVPSAASAAILPTTSAPYVDVSPPGPPSRIQAFTTPETPTAAKHHAAIVE